MANKLKRLLRKLVWFFTVYIIPRHDSTIKVKNGILTFDSKDRTIGRSLYLEGDFDYSEIHKLVGFLKNEGFLKEPEKNIVLDVGANIGMISIAMLRDSLFSEAIAFEPDPNNFRLLEINYEQNGLVDRVKALNVGLSNMSCKIQMELSDKNCGDHRIRSSDDTCEALMGEEDRKTIDVDIKTLDEVLVSSDLDAGRVKLIWMDIQGHEGKFFQGATGFFRAHKDVPVFMEFWPYAIERSGINKYDFCNAVEALFNSFYLVEGDDFCLKSIGEIGLVFDRYSGPDGSADPALGTHLLFVNN